ncbi:DNA polymerase [Phaeovulum vinaykumarii]|uniref:DNA-directed DNA polymerase n=1 Tax=Phaeovulum vinaykumarii TaxID=407234 RepID=A0A1N7JVP2_9RHOB|nr:DNA polymerase [Phaeovulum vinaykumarii]SIS53351.1 DNA polymerase type B [Phaeovulum vinaykumarii]SOB91562.1 DNA polymerase family B [Phaeovulum vinaykumarii]
MATTPNKPKPENLKSALVLDAALFKAPPRRGVQADSIFLIGFDTEYEKSDSTDEEEAKSNRVLSYQYCGLMVDEDSDQADRKWSGIIYPKGPTVEGRLTIPEFLHHVIQDGLKQHPALRFPSRVYLVAHFTRADVPGFREFKDKTLRDRLLLQNIRSLFMNLESPFVVEFQSETEGKPVELKASFRDTMTLAPTGLRSLDDLGKLVGVPKLKLSDDPKQEYYYKTHMGRLLEDDRSLFERYAIRDAEVCAAYAAQMIRASDDNLGAFALPTTLSAKGLKLLKKFWDDNRANGLALVGKEEVDELIWSTKFNRHVKRKSLVNMPFLHWNEQFLTEAYHGGRNEQFWFGPAPEGVWYDYDLASAYPSAMSLIGTPDWTKFYNIPDTDTLLSERFSSSDLAFANVDFEFPDDVLYPVLPVRTTYGLIFPRKGNSTTHISEIRLAHRLGCKIKLIEGRYVESSGSGDPGMPAKSIRPFADFAKFCIDNRNEFPKGTLQNLMWKEIVNSTYGKTGQGLRERRVYDLRDADTKLLPPSDITNPAYASFITAFCRGVLGEIMNTLPKDVSIFSVTTDGFLTTASPDQMQAATKGELCQFYQKARAYLSGKSDIYEVKHIIRRPLGWRTRGQATLVPSQPDDWQGAGISHSDDGSIVLAKGGIKLNGRLSKAEQNQEILTKFAGRKPDDILVYSIGSGPKFQYVEGSDFIDIEVVKKLSMEFDWKRRPSEPEDSDVSGTIMPGDRHLSFKTIPWDDVRLFNMVRENWGVFRQSSPRCLKSVHDLKAFSAFHENTSSLEGEAGKYLRRENGTMKRLRQQIAVAQNHRAAGTHRHNPIWHDDLIILQDGKLTAKLLARFLDEVIGIPCKQEDIENDRKKKVFTPGQVPNTTEVREKLMLLKEKLFPDLKLEEFLASNKAVSLIG